MSAGTYTIKFKPTWTAYDVKDYTVNLYSPKQINIFDSAGKSTNVTVNLMNTLNSLNTANYALTNGGWYGVRNGWVGSNSDTYFYQFSNPQNNYNLNVTV